MAIEYIAFEDKEVPGDWRVEAMSANNEPIVAIFAGYGAKQRAEAYAIWMNGKWREAPQDRLRVKTTDGRDVLIVLSGVEWVQNAKRNEITARTKSNIISEERI